MAKLYTQLQEVCDFASNANPLSDYPGGKFTAIANDVCFSSGGLCLRTSILIPLYTFNTATTPPANSAVEAVVNSGVGDRFIGVVGRYVNATNFYMMWLETGAGLLQLHRSAGGFTLVGSYATAAKSGTIYTEFADEVGGHTQINVYFDNVLRIEYHDETPVGYGAASKAGIRWGNAALSVRGSLDNLAVYVAPAVNVPAAYFMMANRGEIC